MFPRINLSNYYDAKTHKRLKKLQSSWHKAETQKLRKCLCKPKWTIVATNFKNNLENAQKFICNQGAYFGQNKAHSCV